MFLYKIDLICKHVHHGDALKYQEVKRNRGEFPDVIAFYYFLLIPSVFDSIPFLLWDYSVYVYISLWCVKVNNPASS